MTLDTVHPWTLPCKSVFAESRCRSFHGVQVERDQRQHVLEPLRGYLALAEKLHSDGTRYASAWNFGPRYTDAQPVEWIVRYLSSKWGSATEWKIDAQEHVHEAQMLKLDWSKAYAALGWQPVFSLPEALDYTIEWYQREAAGARARELCLEQIVNYSEKLVTAS